MESVSGKGSWLCSLPFLLNMVLSSNTWHNPQSSHLMLFTQLAVTLSELFASIPTSTDWIGGGRYKTCLTLVTTLSCIMASEQLEGLCDVKAIPLKSFTPGIIEKLDEQIIRCIENFRELCAQENMVVQLAIWCTLPLPIRDELDVPPTLEEVDEASDWLECSKLPGNDDIPSRNAKAGKGKLLLRHSHELLLQCLEKGWVHQDIHDAKVITPYKS